MGNFEKAKSAFTLAETLIVVAVLGVIAMLTIPNLIKNQIEAQHRTKVKKSMTVYDLALSKIVVDNDIKNNSMLAQYAEEQKEANCEDSSKYFKKSKETSNGCIFMTSDKVWHNIEDIRRPVISFEEITPENKDEITANANTRANKKAFVLVGHFDDTTGALRVDDLNFEKNNAETVDGNSSYDQVSKNFDFINNKKDDAEGNTNTCNVNDIYCMAINGISFPVCTDEKKSCVNYEMSTSEFYSVTNGPNYANIIYDENGNTIGVIYEYPSGRPKDYSYKNADGTYDFIRFSVNDVTGELYMSYEARGGYGYGYTANQDDPIVNSYAVNNTNGEIYKQSEMIVDPVTHQYTYKYWKLDDNGKPYVYQLDSGIRYGEAYTTIYGPDGSVISYYEI